VVKAGDIVTVRVTEVDLARKRIALSMRKERSDPAPESRERPADRKNAPRRGSSQPPKPAPGGTSSGSLGAALLDAMKRRE
jgi:protein Tex